jgi:hypothetical protein
MTHKTIRARVRKVNETLIKKGFSIDEIITFWNEVFQEVKPQGQLKLKL